MPDNREPVSDYRDARRWLFTHSRFEDWGFSDDEPLPPEAKLVCDMFWISRAKLIKDMRKIWNDALDVRPSPPLRASARYGGGWR